MNARVAFLLASGAFLAGVVLGWKLHAWRVKYLKRQRDYYAKKALSVQKQMEE